ncbi:hypothetical protein RhiirA5_437330 [Rhizophagus irregularis]|uniref:Uncharacterized protein n=1 Tax=Rhizophagus irregularis TaxID=588596 RepID=A0A2N0QXB2_9GLOM|nr:hypothetical protein RhiirA5_437330 [Rhizophagus irregularis]PKC55705.1 hypothetical protein RhiirA1_475154 [Rhizophagus irregularis]
MRFYTKLKSTQFLNKICGYMWIYVETCLHDSMCRIPRDRSKVEDDENKGGRMETYRGKGKDRGRHFRGRGTQSRGRR